MARRIFFLLPILALFIAATLQSGELITFFGVKPNLVLVLLSTFSFFVPNLLTYAMLVLFGTAVLSFAPGLSWDNAALTLVALLFFYVRDRFLVIGLSASILFAIFGTVLFYLLTSPTMLYDEVGVVLKELIYNALLGVTLFSLNNLFYEKKGGSSIR